MTTTDLSGEFAVVTGALGRLGPIWMAALRDAGATVIGCDLPMSLFWHQPEDILPADIREAADIRRLLADCQRLFGRAPTIIVNNAGVDDRPSAPGTDPIAPMPIPVEGAWVLREPTARLMLDTNLYGTWLMHLVVGEVLQPGARVINVASLYGLVAPDARYYGDSGWMKHAMYGATKAGIISLTKHFAGLWGARGIRVNAIAPGGVVCPTDPLTGQNPDFQARYTARIPLGRMCTPTDLAGPLVFLASGASSFVTGHTLIVDGGFTCW
jgi:NAD(P)-dependent dehydrogenase (short-subunit alcohol dehydrogenase family)